LTASRWVFCTCILCCVIGLLFSASPPAALAGTTGLVAGLRLNGGSAGDYFGWSMARIGDVSGDGVADFAFGMPPVSSGSTAKGHVRVYSGADWSIIRTHEGDNGGQLGTSMAPAGDINGDGRADYLVGAPTASTGTPAGRAGVVVLYSGMDGSVLRQFNGTQNAEWFGSSVAAVGDITGDGITEVLVGAPLYDYAGFDIPGKAYLCNGATGGFLHTFNGTNAVDKFGYSVAGVGDVNGDGAPDLLVGAFYADPGGTTDAGSAFLYSGADYSLLHQFDGEAAGDRLGFAVAGIADVNGDTYPDLLIGAYTRNSPGGSAYLYSGADYSLIHRFDGETASSLFGCSVADAGDVDGDGTPDLLTGAFGAGGTAGRAYLYSGYDFGLIRRWDGTAVGERLGWAVAPAGDANGDGKLDVMLSAYNASPGGLSAAGSVFIVTGCCAPMVINDDAASTDSADVTLKMTAFGAAQMRFKNDGEAWSDWEPYATTKAWSLTSGSGTRKVWAQFHDLLGSDSAEVYDEITLAEPPTADSISINTGSACTNVVDVVLTIAATNAAEMCFRNETGAWSAWEPYATSKNWALSAGRGLKTVGFKVRNVALQESSEITDTIRVPTFQDVSCLHSQWAYIEALVAAGITTGCQTNPPMYCPTASITRAQMAVFLCRAAGKTVLNRDTPTFADVAKGSTYYGYIERLADPASWGGNPPTTGCATGPPRLFCPSNPVTREQMAKFLCVATGRQPMPTCSGTFADAGTGNSFCRFIERLTDGPSWPGGVAVTSGCTCPPEYPGGSSCYCPKSNVTRGQMAVFLVRAFGIPL
jgi:hypothetical protein